MHPHLNCSKVKFVKVPAPPIPEQKEIESHIEQKNNVFDQLTAESTLSIKLLKEHRTALISAAVTGKIDVRNG